MLTATERAVGNDERATLKLLALRGGLDGEIKVSCANLADDLDASNQTASRRLQRLDDADLLTRETVSDGQWVTITSTGERELREAYAAYRGIFEEDLTVELAGNVTGGMGEGRHYITLPGYAEQFEERLGYEPYPGTLNVDLTEECARARTTLAGIEPISIDGWEDEDRTYGPAVCCPATVETADGAYDRAHVIAPERTHHDDDQLEVIAPDKLREALDLDDDDRVTVRIEGKA